MSAIPAAVWVESPLQLLSAVEAHHAGILGPAGEVFPRSGSDPLRMTAAELGLFDLPAGLSLREDRRRPERGEPWVIGDAFSGLVQRRLTTGAPRAMVILDDGLATIHLLELLTASSLVPLTRARSDRGPARRALGMIAALRLRAAAREGRLTVFTALPIGAALRDRVRRLGAEVVPHDFPWLRGLPAEPPPVQRLVVLGTSLVANGLVHRAPYLAWVRSLAAEEPIAYRPHRRECPEILAELRRDPRITVAEAGVPVELALRGLTAEHRVVSLPSTALTSLRLVLRANGTTIDGVSVPADWWTERADAELRAHLSLFLNGLEPAL